MDRNPAIASRNLRKAASVLTALLTMPILACGGSGSRESGTGGATTSSSGGVTGSGGITGSGGVTGSGGITGRGGITGSGGKTGAGGKTGGGGTGPASGGSGGACSSVTPCGGDVLGAWDVTSSCLTVTGTLNPGSANMDCSTAPVTGSLSVKGTWTAKAGGTYSDNTVTSGTVQFTLAKSCLVISSTPIDCEQAARASKILGFTDATCSNAADGGCSCSGTVEQSGSVGILDMGASKTGQYKTSGNTLTLSGDDSQSDALYSYCVAGPKLTLSPQDTGLIIKGTVELQKQGTPGSGGSTGAGGSTGVGGATAAGGATGSGGKTGAGGTTGAGGATTGSGGGTGAGGSTGVGTRPCDIFAAANTPCVAAHSTVRALLSSYNKPLYQVRKGGTWSGSTGTTGGTTKDIPVLAGTGIVDASAQDEFCGTTAKACTISIIYDQTGNGNDLKAAKMCSSCSGCGDSTRGQPDLEAYADGAKTTISGKTAYGVRILACGGGIPNQTGYRSTTPGKMPTGDQPESTYFVVDGANMNGGCCFDYGNANPDGTASGNMDAIYIGAYGVWGTGAGSGPWLGADLEAGIYTWNGKSGNWKNPNSLSMKYPFVTGVMKNNQNGKTADEGPFVIKGADGRSGALTTMWSGARPQGYETMSKKGGIVLGIGGDGAAGANGTFFEGAITAAFNSKATDDAIQANVIAAGYGK